MSGAIRRKSRSRSQIRLFGALVPPVAARLRASPFTMGSTLRVYIPLMAPKQGKLSFLRSPRARGVPFRRQPATGLRRASAVPEAWVPRSECAVCTTRRRRTVFADDATRDARQDPRKDRAPWAPRPFPMAEVAIPRDPFAESLTHRIADGSSMPRSPTKGLSRVLALPFWLSFSRIGLLPTQRMYGDCESSRFESSSITRVILIWEIAKRGLD